MFAVFLALPFLWHREPPSPPPVIVFEKSYTFPQQPISLFARWVPITPGWAWLWHLKEKVCGKIKAIEVRTDIITVAQSSTLSLTASSLSDSELTGAGSVRVWLLDTRDLDSLRPQIRNTPGYDFIISPRISTGDGAGASLFSGNTIVLSGFTNEVGVRVTYVPRIRHETTDLLASLAYVDTVTNETGEVAFQTNLDVKARFQIPKDKGVLLLQSVPGKTKGSATAVIISAKL